MPRVEKAYEVPVTGGHVQLTSAGTGNPSAAATKPAGANACYLQAIAIDAYVTLDGSTPTSSNGLRIYAGQMPFYMPVGDGASIRMDAVSAAVSTLNVAWLK